MAFCDPSGLGTLRADSMTLAIAHADPEGRLILDLVPEVRPPASPNAVVAGFAELLVPFGITQVVGDAYGGTWPTERFAAHGITYIVAGRTRSEIYRDLLPAFASRGVTRPAPSPGATLGPGAARRRQRQGRKAPPTLDRMVSYLEQVKP